MTPDLAEMIGCADAEITANARITASGCETPDRIHRDLAQLHYRLRFAAAMSTVKKIQWRPGLWSHPPRDRPGWRPARPGASGISGAPPSATLPTTRVSFPKTTCNQCFTSMGTCPAHFGPTWTTRSARPAGSSPVRQAFAWRAGARRKRARNPVPAGLGGSRYSMRKAGPPRSPLHYLNRRFRADLSARN